MVHLFLFVSLILFGADVADMGSDNYAVRERASLRVELLTPLSHHALERGLLSRDAEVRRRCRDALVISHRRLEPLRVGIAYARAIDLIYGPGTWHLSRNQERAVISGDYRLHHAMYVVAKVSGVLRYETAPCEERKRQWANNLPVEGYQSVEMVGFANVMRRRLRGLTDMP